MESIPCMLGAPQGCRHLNLEPLTSITSAAANLDENSTFWEAPSLLATPPEWVGTAASVLASGKIKRAEEGLMSGIMSANQSSSGSCTGFLFTLIVNSSPRPDSDEDFSLSWKVFGNTVSPSCSSWSHLSLLQLFPWQDFVGGLSLRLLNSLLSWWVPGRGLGLPAASACVTVGQFPEGSLGLGLLGSKSSQGFSSTSLSAK